MRVRFRVHRHGDEAPYPVFTPAEGAYEGLKRGTAAIVGVAESDLGAGGRRQSVVDLMAQGIKRALDDCGLKLTDVDGLFCGDHAEPHVGAGAGRIPRHPNPPSSAPRSSAARRSSPTSRTPGARSSGLCEVAVIAYGSTQRSVGRKQAPAREYNPTKRRSGRSCRRAPTRWPPRATCTSTARRASSWPRSRWRRANGRCSIRPPGRRSR